MVVAAATAAAFRDLCARGRPLLRSGALAPYKRYTAAYTTIHITSTKCQ
jgi:hypothetical protein